MVQIWQEDPEKKDLAQFIFNELYAMVVCVEYNFCDKCVTADWRDAKEQNYIYKTDVNLYVSR